MSVILLLLEARVSLSFKRLSNLNPIAEPAWHEKNSKERITECYASRAYLCQSISLLYTALLLYQMVIFQTFLQI